jgi:hypothetical protein
MNTLYQQLIVRTVMRSNCADHNNDTSSIIFYSDLWSSLNLTIEFSNNDVKLFNIRDDHPNWMNVDGL